MNLFKNRSWSILLQTVAGASRSLLFCLVSCFWILASLPAPAIIDTNNNGISDIWERQYNNGELFPNNFNLLADPDGDGLTDTEEAKLGTDPQNPTTLAGIADLWLAKNFTGILLNGGLSTIDPNGDPDGDSYTNLEEYLADTNPNDISSLPAGTPSVIASIPKSVAGSFYDYYPGYPCGQPVILYLNQALPASTSITGSWISDTSSGAPVPATGTTIILPGRRAIAFVPSGNSFTPWPDDDSPTPSYQIDFTAETAGLAHILPFHNKFTTTTAAGSIDGGPSFGITSPGRDYIDAACDTTITAQWSEPLAPATVIPANVSLVTAAGNAVACAVSFDYGKDVNLLRITPAVALAPATQYTVTLGTGFQNLTAKAHAQAVSWSFTTRPVRVPPSTGAGPYVASVFPGDYAYGIAPPSGVTLTFSEAMDSTTLTADHIHLRGGNGPDLPGTFTYSANTLSLLFQPDTPLVAGTYYALTLDLPNILNSPASGSAVPMQGNNTFVFATAATGSGGGGGGGGGTPSPASIAPLNIHYTWGEAFDSDGDSGCSVDIKFIYKNGSSQTKSLPADTTALQLRDSGPIPAGTTVIITPNFVPGSDKDKMEELYENGVKIDLSDGALPPGMTYLVFRKTPAATQEMEYLGLFGGTSEYSCQCADAQGNGPQSLYLVPVEVDFITRDTETGECTPLGALVEESDSRPDVEIESLTSVIQNNGTLKMDLSGKARERFSELLAAGDGKVSTVDVILDGNVIDTLSVTPLSDGVPVKSPWLRRDSTVSFAKTITINDISPGLHNVVVRSNANVLNRKGWDGASILIEKQNYSDISLAEAPAFELTLPASLTASADSLTLQSNGQTAILTEPAGGEALALFTGSISMNGQARDVRVQLDKDLALSSNQPNDIIVEISWPDDAGGMNFVKGKWTETSAGSLIFSAASAYTTTESWTNIQVTAVTLQDNAPTRAMNP